MTSHQDDDDDLSLSASTLDALKAFYAERDARAQEFARLQARAGGRHPAAAASSAGAGAGAGVSADGDLDGDGDADAKPGVGVSDRVDQPISMEAFTEDWNESQFWYADETATLFAKELLEGTTSDSTIAVVSTPSVFVMLKNILNAAPPDQPKPKLLLLEHDRRFAVFPEFVYYDLNEPLKLPPGLKGTCDRLMLDPPFLSEDCQTKMALTLRYLSKPPSPPSRPPPPPPPTSLSPPSSSPPPPSQPIPTNDQNHDDRHQQPGQQQHPRVIICTGERMRDVVLRLYRPLGVRVTDYEPVHARGLSNEFYVYTNFESAGWGWRGWRG